jgi:hypothetical protein
MNQPAFYNRRQYGGKRVLFGLISVELLVSDVLHDGLHPRGLAPLSQVEIVIAAK